MRWVGWDGGFNRCVLSFFLILTYFEFFFFLERRRRIPFDFQRTSLAGLALESATSSGLGRAPALQCRTPSRHHLELQDRRDYAPVDTAARTCWLGCPGSCTIWRPEMQNSAFLRYPLHGRFLQDPTSLVQRASEVQNPAPSASFPREQSVVSSYQK
ncbi:hypothetical protein TNCV_53621 [Trichonephila clavipes]|nr:hypothetical protein TNCV_53621 [Trichonephila clavipes]